MRKQKGITLIATAITIIVLVILAAISISLTVGEEGILSQALHAKSKQEIAETKEELQMAIKGAMTKGLGNLNYENLVVELNDSLGVGNYEIEETETGWLITTRGLRYTIARNGEITFDGETLNEDDNSNEDDTTGENNTAGSKEIIMLSNVEERDGKTYINLQFTLAGVPTLAEYANENMDESIQNFIDSLYPDKLTNDLEDMYVQLMAQMGETVKMDDSVRTEIQDMVNGEFGTDISYDGCLRAYISLLEAQINSNTDTFYQALMINIQGDVYYKYACLLLGMEPCETATDIEYQAVDLFNFNGTFEQLILEMDMTRAKLEEQAAAMGVSYTAFLKLMFAQTIDEYGFLDANVTVSDGNNFQFNIMEDTYSYEITKTGNYTFYAELPDGSKGEITVDALVHTYPENAEIIVAATCTTNGEMGRVCTVCGHVQRGEIIYALGHDISSEVDTVIEDATCTSYGKSGKSCSRCDYVQQYGSIAPLGHDLPTEANVVMVEATCTTDGMYGRACTRCDYVLGANTIPALGHNYVDYICTRCNGEKPLEAGEYVYYNKSYTDAYNTANKYEAHNGWRYLGKDNSGNHLLISTGIVGKVWFSGNVNSPASWWSGVADVNSEFGVSWTGMKEGYSAYYAACGLRRNFAKVEMTGPNGSIMGNSFIIDNRVKVTTILRNQVPSNWKTITGTQKGLYNLNDLELTGFSYSATNKWGYWLATPDNTTSSKDMLPEIDYVPRLSAVGGYSEGLRPVIVLPSNVDFDVPTGSNNYYTFSFSN